MSQHPLEDEFEELTIVRTRLETYQERLMCPECGEEMTSTNGISNMRGSTWTNLCKNNHKLLTTRSYPRITYTTIDEEKS